MSKKQFKIGSNSRINFELCDDRVSLEGSSKGLFSYSSRGNVSVMEEGDLVNVLSEFDIKASVPKQAPITIQKAEGRISAKDLHSLQIDDSEFEVKVSDIREGLTLGQVRSYVEAKKTGGISANLIDGYISAREIRGDIKIGTVLEDFSVRRATGKVEVRKIEGDVELSGITGGIKLEDVQGYVTLQGPLSAEKHTIISAGDVTVTWPADQKVQFLVTHKGELYNQMGLPNETMVPGSFQATIGDDSCKLIIDAEGDVTLRPMKKEKLKEKERSKPRNIKKPKKKDFDLDLEDLLDPEELIEKVGKGIKSIVKGKKSGGGKGLFGKIFDGAMREVDEWAGVPEERARREKAADPAPAKNAEEERRMILKMLENGSISVDEATERLKNL